MANPFRTYLVLLLALPLATGAQGATGTIDLSARDAAATRLRLRGARRRGRAQEVTGGAGIAHAS